MTDHKWGVERNVYLILKGVTSIFLFKTTFLHLQTLIFMLEKKKFPAASRQAALSLKGFEKQNRIECGCGFGFAVFLTDLSEPLAAPYSFNTCRQWASNSDSSWAWLPGVIFQGPFRLPLLPGFYFLLSCADSSPRRGKSAFTFYLYLFWSKTFSL